MTANQSMSLVSGLIFAVLALSQASWAQPSRVQRTSWGAEPAATLAVNGVVMGDGRFIIRGVGYSPVPIGADPTAAPPYGDYFTAPYSALHRRDLPLLRAMGANTLRLWGWNNGANHDLFLDAAYNEGIAPLYVIATFWIDPGADLANSAVRNRLKQEFVAMVRSHKHHPAIIMWAIGNELNLSHQGQLQYLFTLLNQMALLAHAEEGPGHRPVTTALADINLVQTIRAFDATVPHLDVWGLNVYRGSSFGRLFLDIGSASAKPTVLLEFGVDAYDSRVCAEYELVGAPIQANYAESLWTEIRNHGRVSRLGVAPCLGGSIMAWMDERWKGKYGQTSGCGSMCPDHDSSLQGTCGYPTGAHPDGWSNEEWWGLVRTARNPLGGPDVVSPREAYLRLQAMWR